MIMILDMTTHDHGMEAQGVRNTGPQGVRHREVPRLELSAWRSNPMPKPNPNITLTLTLTLTLTPTLTLI